MVRAILKMMVFKVIYCLSQCTDILKRLEIFISLWKSKGSSDESINPPTTSDNILAPSLNLIGARIRVKFGGSCLKQDKITFTHGKTVNTYIVYKINLWDCGYDNYPRLENSVFAAVKLVKMLIWISTNTLDMVLNFIGMEVFQ